MHGSSCHRNVRWRKGYYMHQGKQVLDTLLYNENQQFHIDEEEMHTIIEYALK